MIFKDYNMIRNECKTFDVAIKKKIGIAIFSLLVPLFIISIPTILLVNLLIFRDYVKLIAVGFGFLLILLFFLIKYFYDLGITEGKIKKVYIISIVNTLFMSVIVIITLIFLFSFGVI